jgi:hypothetical protein
MKVVDESLNDSGFEEVRDESGSEQNEQSGKKPESAKTGTRPDFSLVQPDTDRDGKTKYINIGGMWKNVSKNGKEFYTVRIGNLKLLAFPNNRQDGKSDL